MSRNACSVWFLLAAFMLAGVDVRNLCARGKVQPVAEPVAKRLVQASDAIRMRVIANYGSGATFSPDRTKAVIVLQQSDEIANSRTYTLFLWSKALAVKETAPKQLLAFVSTSIRPGIQRAIWLEDSRILYFLGERSGEKQQLYMLDVISGSLRRCTNHSTNIRSFSITPDGREFAFVAEEPVRGIIDQTVERGGLVIGVGPDFQLPDLVRVNRGGAMAMSEPRVFLGSCGGAIRSLVVPGEIAPWGPTPEISPDGRYVVIEELLDDPPPSWGKYRYHNVHRRTSLVSTSSGRYQVLLDSPQGLGGSDFAWAADSESVVVSNTLLPTPADVTEEERMVRLSTPFLVEVTIPEGKFTKIDAAGTDLRLREWDRRRNILVLSRGEGGENLAVAAYTKRIDGTWKRLEGDVSLDEGITIREIQGLNTPPRLFVVNDKTQEKSLLLDLNPQFSNLRFAHVEEIRWKAAGGYNVVGGLYYPLDYIVGRRYPLVIQTHGFDSKKFVIDGPNSSSFAAQALAARGIMVVQLDNDFVEDFGTFKEVQREGSKFEDTIAFLDHKGLIDPNRVGMIGFSRTCLYVKYALTRKPFAAASVEDGWDGGYWQFLTFGNFSDDFSASHTGMYDGELPFGRGLATWSSRSPGFNVEKVRTPLRILAPGSTSLLGEWEWFSALKILHKPVEMVLMEDDDHPLVLPWNRLISQGGNVEWFDFWLQGHEDPDPSKREQYTRWEKLCDIQIASRPDHPAFCVGTKH